MHTPRLRNSLCTKVVLLSRLCSFVDLFSLCSGEQPLLRESLLTVLFPSATSSNAGACRGFRDLDTRCDEEDVGALDIRDCDAHGSSGGFQFAANDNLYRFLVRDALHFVCASLLSHCVLMDSDRIEFLL